MTQFSEYMDEKTSGALVTALEKKLGDAITNGVDVTVDPAAAMWLLVNMVNHAAISTVLEASGLASAVTQASGDMARERLNDVVPHWAQMRRPT